MKTGIKIGIYNPNLSTKGGGEKVCLALSETLAASNNIHVILITHEIVNIKDLESYFGVSLDGVKIEVLQQSVTLGRLRRRARIIPEGIMHLLENHDKYRKIKKLNLDVFVNNAYNTDIPAPAKTGVYMCMFPHKFNEVGKSALIKRAYYSVLNFTIRNLMHPGKKHWLDSYQFITANSAFTQKYIYKYWHRDSYILYPICDNLTVAGVQKKKMILNVGRFFHNNGITHHKRQDYLIESFIKMADLHKDGWELHFAGTVNSNVEDMIFALGMHKKADGYPIYFHYNASFEKLRKIYTEASIYWHATGYGVSSTKNPERQEHFGISTVEAMATGAIPVVISTAGQKEIVKEGVDGYLWTNGEELEAKTRLVASGKSKINSNDTINSAKRFSKKEFVNSVNELLKEILE